MKYYGGVWHYQGRTFTTLHNALLWAWNNKEV